MSAVNGRLWQQLRKIVISSAVSMGYGEGRYVERAGGHRMLKSLKHLVCQNRTTTGNGTSVRMLQETPPNHERLESRAIMFSSGDVLCS